MNFDLTLICHKLLVNFSLFKAKRNIDWTKRNLNINEYHDNCNSYKWFFVVLLRTM